MKTVILIDDHPIVRLGIRSLLETEGNISIWAEAGSRKEAFDLLKDGSPDLAMVDLLLGNDDGLNLIKELKSYCPDMKTLVMTMQDESVYAERVIRAGADGFIAKQDATEDLLEAVRTVLSGDVYLSRASSARILHRMLRESSSGAESKVGDLSDRELHVFQLIGNGLATREIAGGLGLSPKTIETYREHIKRKLCLKNADALKHAARKWVDEGRL